MGPDRILSPVFEPADRETAARLFDAVRAATADEVGVTRASYGEGETAAMEIVAAVAREHGLDTTVDPAGNLVLTLPGDARREPAVWIGSHLDSVPRGGNYDGLAGVIAGLLCLAKLNARGATPPRPIQVVGFRGEESAWFGKAYLGSSALFGKLTARDLDRRRADDGKPLGDYMAAAGIDTKPIAAGERLVDPAAIAAYLELHIEQGPIMVARGVPVGVVTGIRGNIRHIKACCRGTAGHSGAVPRWLRHDSVFAFADLLMRLDDNWQALLARGLDLVVTSGVVGTNPADHSISRIPGDLNFALEIRSQSIDTLEAFYQLVLVECASIERARGVKFVFDERVVSEPGVIDREWIARLRKICTALGVSYIEIPSGAGHDAAVFANQGVPSGMIFIRNAHGSHNPEESMDLADFMLGVEVLYHASTGLV